MKRKSPVLLLVIVVALFGGLLALTRFINANAPVDHDEDEHAPAASAPAK